MRRRILTIASAVSLLLFVVTAVLWVSDRIITKDGIGHLFVETTLGVTYLRVEFDGYMNFMAISPYPRRPLHFAFQTPDEWLKEALDDNTVGVNKIYRSAGNSYGLYRHEGGTVFLRPQFAPCNLWSLKIHPSVLAVLFATGALWVIYECARKLKRERNRKRGRCLTCGYSLTGNTSGTCPECGTAVPQASRPA